MKNPDNTWIVSTKTGSTATPADLATAIDHDMISVAVIQAAPNKPVIEVRYTILKSSISNAIGFYIR